MVQTPPASQDFCARYGLWALLAGHLLLWTVVPSLTQPNLPLDCVEMAVWGYEWELGYYKHPPLPAWIAQAFSRLGDNHEWPIYLASQLCTIGCLWAAWSLAKRILPPAPALLAAASLELSYYYTFTTPEFNNNVVSRLCWAMAILFLYRGLTEKKNRFWTISGVWLGMGMLSKYDSALLAMTFLAISACLRQGRIAWKTAGPYCLLVAALVIFLPHLYWVFANGFPTFRYFAARSAAAANWFDHLQHPTKFYLAQLAAIGPSMGVCYLLACPQAGNVISEERRFAVRFLVLINWLPCMTVVAYAFMTGASVLTMWGAPMWTYAPVAILAWRNADSLRMPTRTWLSGAIACSLVTAIVFGAGQVGHPYVLGRGGRVHFPGERLAREVDRAWSETHEGIPPVVGGPWWVAGNAAFYLPGEASLYIDLDPEKSPWLSDDEFIATGGAIVWQIGHKDAIDEREIHQRFPEARILAPIHLNWETDAPTSNLSFGIAVLDGYPRPAETSASGNVPPPL